jgi:transposase-like protein
LRQKNEGQFLKEELMPDQRSRIFSREFKLEAVSRIEAGGNVSALARELGVRRKLLYEWRDAWRAGGADALRPPGRPRTGAAVAWSRDSGASKPPPAPAGPQAQLAAARRRIAELERKVGQQALEADFFRQALRQVETLRRPSDRPGGTASTPSSGRGRGGKAD